MYRMDNDNNFINNGDLHMEGLTRCIAIIITAMVLGCVSPQPDRSEIRRKVLYELGQRARHHQLELETQELERERNAY